MRSRLVLSCLLFAACSSGGNGNTGTPPDSPVTADAADVFDTPPPPDAGPIVVFPMTPIVGNGAPSNADVLFGDPSIGIPGGPCIAEPSKGTLLPKKFLRQRFRLIPANGENLFEIRLHTPSIDHDLVAYTASTTWIVPQAIWDAMNTSLIDQPIEYRVRAAQWNGTALIGQPTISATGTFRIAPVDAPGTIVYWTSGASGNTTAFKGFNIGDETVHDVMGPSAVPGGGVLCVGCHTSTPDGKYVAFSANSTVTDGRNAHVDMRSLDGNATQPPFLTPSALTLINRSPNQQSPAYSAAHWADGDHMMLSMFPVSNVPSIIWTNLEATSTDQGTGWGVIARTGDPGQAGAGTWSHDGQTIAYSSGPLVTSGMNLDNGRGDIYTVPYNGGAGGNATKLLGASDTNYSESYAAFSRDDALIAFVRVPATQNPYNNPQEEVYLVPRAGGVPTRLMANDPMECTAAVSPGASNSWPKWSPKVQLAGTTKYYWLTFSSRRQPGATQQIYVAPVTVDANGAITTYPAVYLWNQPTSESNHTPAWDEFQVIF
ncbi:MAG: uncharacterized protein JWO36_2239 [Myxococcales bacterium]|nr:uncharacterized protein [Myxococcales bacterium]